ncbi:unnamed protein product [Parnassius apollo]|nr:unnamed protein product [Parnassius apollo]
MVEWVLRWAGSRPWLAGAGALLAFALLAFAAYWCCGPSAHEPEMEYKKTDAMTEDDPHQSDTEEHAPETRPKASKANLEGPEPVVDSPPDQPDDQDAVVDSTEQPQIDTEGAGDGQRKRKPRKE